MIMKAKEQKAIQIATDSDTNLFLSLCKSEVTGARGTGKPFYEVALTLSTHTGAMGDGEQTAILTSEQVDSLIEQLRGVQEAILKDDPNK